MRHSQSKVTSAIVCISDPRNGVSFKKLHQPLCAFQTQKEVIIYKVPQATICTSDQRNGVVIHKVTPAIVCILDPKNHHSQSSICHCTCFRPKKEVSCIRCSRPLREVRVLTINWTKTARRNRRRSSYWS